jgi:hypothetical protein
MNTNLTALEWMLLGIFVPSGVMKMVHPKILQDIWQLLPNWFWFPCGLWELLSALLMVYPPFHKLGASLLFVYMGGVFASIVWIPTDKQYPTNSRRHSTLLSGNNPVLGKIGMLPLIPATLSTLLIYYMDKEYSGNGDRSLMQILNYGMLGFAWGAVLPLLKKEEGPKLHA